MMEGRRSSDIVPRLIGCVALELPHLNAAIRALASRIIVANDLFFVSFVIRAFILQENDSSAATSAPSASASMARLASRNGPECSATAILPYSLL